MDYINICSAICNNGIKQELIIYYQFFWAPQIPIIYNVIKHFVFLVF